MCDIAFSRKGTIGNGEGVNAGYPGKLAFDKS